MTRTEASGYRRGFWHGVLAGAIVAFFVGHARADEIGPAIATATTRDGATVTLHGGAGMCVNGAFYAVWRPAPGSTEAPIPGCWRVIRGGIAIVYLDADRGTIPDAELTKVKDS